MSAKARITFFWAAAFMLLVRSCRSPETEEGNVTVPTDNTTDLPTYTTGLPTIVLIYNTTDLPTYTTGLPTIVLIYNTTATGCPIYNTTDNVTDPGTRQHPDHLPPDQPAYSSPHRPPDHPTHRSADHGAPPTPRHHRRVSPTSWFIIRKNQRFTDNCFRALWFFGAIPGQTGKQRDYKRLECKESEFLDSDIPWEQGLGHPNVGHHGGSSYSTIS